MRAESSNVNVTLGQGLLQFLQEMVDWRGHQGRRHDLTPMLATIVCAMLCGHGSPEQIARWIKSFDSSFWHKLGYRRRPPVANTFRTILEQIDPQEFESALARWVASVGLSTQGQHGRRDACQPDVIIIDGKMLRGAMARHAGMWHLLAAFDQQTGQVLRQVPVPSTTNEAKAVLSLLNDLVLEGKVIVADAAFCQREVCRQILDTGGDYLIIVKENQPTLHKNVESAFCDERIFSPLPTARVPGSAALA